MKKPEAVKAKATRPGSVVVAGWCAILAVPLILGRITLVVLSRSLEDFAAFAASPSVWLTPEGLDSLAILLVAPIAVISLLTGIAILRMQRWAWVVLMTFLVLALVVNLVRSYYHSPEYGLMLIYAALTLLLNQPDVRKAFRIGRPAYEPVE